MTRYLYAFLCLLFLRAGDVTAQTESSRSEAMFRVYDARGNLATLNDVVAASDSVAVLFIGEEHDDSLAHVVQSELLTRSYFHHRTSERPRPVTLSLEMFEQNVQYILDEYLDGLITEQHFQASSRPWPNYARDYRPLVEFARTHGLKVLASNAPRRYVNLVAREGSSALNRLSENALRTLPPLPYAEASPEYKAKWDRMMGQAMPSGTGAHGDANDTASSRMLEAQSLWDASMAFSIAGHLKAHPDALVIHLAGSFHVTGHTGIPEHLQRFTPRAKALVVAVERAGPDLRFDAEKHQGLGDFVILTSN